MMWLRKMLRPSDFLNWKRGSDTRLGAIEVNTAALQAQQQAAAQASDEAFQAFRQHCNRLEGRLSDLEAVAASLRSHVDSLLRDRFSNAITSACGADAAHRVITFRHDALLILKIPQGLTPSLLVGGAKAEDLVEAFRSGQIRRLVVKTLGISGAGVESVDQQLIRRLADFVSYPGAFSNDLDSPDHPHGQDKADPPPAVDPPFLSPTQAYRAALALLNEDRWLVDFVAEGVAARNRQESNAAQSDQRPNFVVPFDRKADLPRLVPAEPKRRSAVFVHNNYYHFNNLAVALRRRGWDAMTVSLESLASPQRQFYHGEDLNLFDSDPEVMRQKTSAFFRTVPERFGALHFYGNASLFPENFENVADPVRIPMDFLELRRHGVVVGFMPTGCHDGATQSEIRSLTSHASTRGICSICVWEDRPEICSDARSQAWRERLESLCDWIGIETDWAAGTRMGKRYVRGPVVTALDPEIWRPDLAVPEDMRVSREPGQILIYHAVGNYADRRVADKDMKGTGALLAAVERLQADGYPVKLVFATNIPSTRVRYLQVQADIVVDQLNYGRCGANAREALMLGKPLVVRLDPYQGPDLPPSRYVLETPAFNAGTSTIDAALRRLIDAPEMREDLARRARDFALAWHGADACAERYETVVDRVRQGLQAETESLFPAPPPDAKPFLPPPPV